MTMSVILSIVRAMSAYRTRAELFPALGEAVRRVIPMDHLALAVASIDEPDSFHFYTDGTFEPDSHRIADYGGSAQAMRSRLVPKIIRIEEIEPYPVHFALWSRLGVTVSCGIPMYAHGRLLGTMGCWARDPHTHDNVDLGLAAALGTAVAVAVDTCLAFERLQLVRDAAIDVQASLREELETTGGFAIGMIGDSAAFQQVRDQIEVVAPTDATVLLTGESGTGKDVVARAIHAASPRRERSLVSINCAALPSTLAESELFGHEEGAFTGAARARIGRFELAHESTLFLDEVGELSLDVQAKLLRVVQERVIERVGGQAPIPLDVRIIAATNRDLRQHVADGAFREDLYYRLSVFPIALPPLRERRDDIPGLVESFVEHAAARLRVLPKRVTADAMRRLRDYDWPGNVRELQNAIERAMIVSAGDVLDVEQIVPRRIAPIDFERAPDSLRDEYRAALDAAGWVIEGPNGAAARIGLHPNTLRHRLKRIGLERPR
jgi:formate hydrogenlyase transcriptional activator